MANSVWWTKAGRIVFALAIAGFGVSCLISADFVTQLEPVPAWVGGRPALAYLTGVFLLIAGASIAANYRVRAVASVLGGMLFLWFVVLHGPRLLAKPRAPTSWTPMFETLALCGAAWLLAGTRGSHAATRKRWDGAVAALPALGRFLLGASLLVFGIQHLMYGAFVAALVPAWIPARLFWAYFIGVAFIAAGLSIITRVKADLAGMLLGIMFGSWVLILHAPRVAANVSSRPEWTSLLIATAMCGGAWLVAGSIRKPDPALVDDRLGT